MRQKDQTMHTCALCSTELRASGMNSHLYHKHDNYGCDRYASEFGEFRQKHKKTNQRLVESTLKCCECNQPVMNHKHLMHHILTSHQRMKWEDYYIKHFFNGSWPLCACGCGNKVKLIKSGKNEKKEIVYARTMLPGHQPWKKPGYRFNTREAKNKMRLAAIKRLETSGQYFNYGPSSLEKELSEFLTQHGIKLEISNRTILAGQELDLYLPEYKIAIEVNGARFHSDIFKSKSYHQKKSDEAIERGIRLIHLWEHDLINKKQQIYQWLLDQLSIKQQRIYARNCIVKEISYKESNIFTNEFHLQGPSISKYRYGLYYNDILISVMTFASPRRILKQIEQNKEYELIRFCTRSGYHVVGGGSKLLNYFIKKEHPSRVISFCNYDRSDGNFYKKIGMKFVQKTPPGYFYVKGKQKITRVSAMKHKLIAAGADPNQTEYEIMTQMGFYRIYDAGNLKFQLDVNIN